MISSIFGKTKPINFIIVLSFLFVLYGFVHFLVLENTYTVGELLFQALVLAVLMGSFFIVNFVVKRNKITGANSFSLLFYVLFMLVFPETLTDNNAIFCNFFLLLAARRLISMRSLERLKSKIFDATLWIMVSSLFYDWAVLYLVLVFIAIYVYEPKNIRNWLVPFAAIVAIFLISYSVFILMGMDDFLISHYQFSFQFNTEYFLNWGSGTRVIVFVALTFIAGIFAFLKLGNAAGLGKLVTLRLIGLYFIAGLALKILSSSAESYPILVTFFPATVFMTNYVESVKKANLKEIILVGCISVAFMAFLIEMTIK